MATTNCCWHFVFIFVANFFKIINHCKWFEVLLKFSSTPSHIFLKLYAKYVEGAIWISYQHETDLFLERSCVCRLKMWYKQQKKGNESDDLFNSIFIFFWGIKKEKIIGEGKIIGSFLWPRSFFIHSSGWFLSSFKYSWIRPKW